MISLGVHRVNLEGGSSRDRVFSCAGKQKGVRVQRDHVVGFAAGQTTDVHAATVVIDHGLRCAQAMGRVELDRVAVAVHGRAETDDRLEAVGPSLRLRQIQLDDGARVGERLHAGGCQLDRASIYHDNEVDLSVDQTAEGNATSGPIDHRLSGFESVRGPEIDPIRLFIITRLVNHLVETVPGSARQARVEENPSGLEWVRSFSGRRERESGGRTWIVGGVVVGKVGVAVFFHELELDDDIVGLAIRQAVDWGASTRSVDHRIAGNEPVGIAQIDGFRVDTA